MTNPYRAYLFLYHYQARQTSNPQSYRTVNTHVLLLLPGNVSDLFDRRFPSRKSSVDQVSSTIVE
jgi:hypothetical protein